MTLIACPALDDYRQAFATLSARGLTFVAKQSVPIARVNYIKTEEYFFTRISEDEYKSILCQD